MRVQGVEIPGTAEHWALRWLDVGMNQFTSYQVEYWAAEVSGVPTVWRNPNVPHRLADRLIQKGRKLGLWRFTGKHWTTFKGTVE